MQLICLILPIIIIIPFVCAQETRGIRIVYGEPTTIEKFPFIVSILFMRMQTCGGSIVSETFILTAAHCATDGNKEPLPLSGFKVLFGHTKWNKGTKRGVEKFIMHEDFVEAKGVIVNDIAMIKLDAPITYSKTVQPIKLHFAKINDGSTNAEVIILGWGNTNRGDQIVDEPNPVLTFAVVHIVPLQECKQQYRRIANITKDHICVLGKDHQGSCEGDSGGPVVIKLKNGYNQIGIVSFIGGSCLSNQPNVNTRVSEYFNWIRKQMLKN